MTDDGYKNRACSSLSMPIDPRTIVASSPDFTFFVRNTSGFEMPSTIGRQLTVLCLTFCCLYTGTSACFIRNCPPGGKRSIEVDSPNERQCMSCGPGGKGQCVGPDICCGDFGCLMGTRETAICRKENESTEPCAVRGEVCGSHGQGNCVADQICCDEDACSFNQRCNRRELQEKVATKNEILREIQKLLLSKN